jgi:hypothetical protein
MLGQSLSPQLKFLIFWQWLGLYVIITSKSDGSAIFVKQVAVLTRLEKSKTSHIVIKGPHLPLETVSLMLKIITYGVQTEMQAVADF